MRHLVALFAVIMLLPLGGLAAARETAPDGKIVRIAMGTVLPPTLDPQLAFDIGQIAVAGLTYEGLTRLDAELNTVPAAAEAWEFSDDGTVLTFHLRPDLTYSDGSPLVADDFRYAVARTCDPDLEALYASILADVVGCAAAGAPLGEELGVTAVDERTLEIRLTHPASYFPTIASTWVFYPVKRALVEAGGETWWQDAANHLGNGPFQITSIVDADDAPRIEYVANARYWGGRPKLDGITYIYGLDTAEEGLAAYTNDSVDIFYPWTSSLPEIAADATLKDELLRYPSATTTILSLNHDEEPFQDKQVREAFAYAFDRAGYCREIGHGGCAPSLSWIPAGIPGAIETDRYGFDPAQAKAALAASSYGGPEELPPIEYRYAADDPSAQIEAEWLAAQFREVLGVELTLIPTDAETMATLNQGERLPQFGWAGWTEDYPDPQNWLSLFWRCDSTIYAARIGYCNPEFDQLVNQADATTDPEQRIALYEEAGRVLVEDVPAPFLWNWSNVVLVKPFVTGYATTPADLWPGWTTPLTIDLEPAA